MNKIVENAYQLAGKVHKDQKYGDQDYVDFHCAGVVNNLIMKYQSQYLPKTAHKIWFDDTHNRDCVEAAAWMHDCIEDAKNREEVVTEISDNFPPLVYDLVNGMTKKTDDYAEYIFGIQDAGAISRPLAAIKMADLDFNIEQSESRTLNSYEKQRLAKYKLARYILMPWGK